VQAVNAGDQGVRLGLVVLVVMLDLQAELFEVSTDNVLQHVLPVLGVVEQRPTVACVAQFKHRSLVVRPKHV